MCSCEGRSEVASLGSLAEFFCFLQAFAFYSSVAIIFDLILQVTAFSAILVLDSKRRQASRLDCVPCIRISGGASVWQLRNQEGLVKRFIRTHYAPALFHPLLKILVVGSRGVLLVVPILVSQPSCLGAWVCRPVCCEHWHEPAAASRSGPACGAAP